MVQLLHVVLPGGSVVTGEPEVAAGEGVGDGVTVLGVGLVAHLEVLPVAAVVVVPAQDALELHLPVPGHLFHCLGGFSLAASLALSPAWYLGTCLSLGVAVSSFFSFGSARFTSSTAS